MRLSLAYLLPILVTSIPAQLLLPKLFAPTDDSSRQTPLVMSPATTLNQGGVLISDVMGRDRSVNVFAGFARDVAEVARRLDDAGVNSTVLAPLNSAIEKLPGKPWEDADDYGALGATAYEGDEGRDRARRNIRRFVEAHVVPVSPWREGEKATSLLDGDREIWWETKEGRMVLQPDGIEIQSVASRVGNGEVWIVKGVRGHP
ncbi:FAS1 domain-containing protein [Nemania sp. NC0429]|nr:FAS1 domain-containing protein [Nemania sp. NC0429]